MQAESLPRLKAPREHGRLLVHPPLDAVPALLRDNRSRLGCNLQVLGRPFSELRAQARAEVLAAARAYHAQAGEPVPAWSGDTWFVAGHQPEFFHPGVWVKNVVLQGFARRHRAIPLNLVVDDDTAKSTSLAIPAGNHVVKIAFDRWQSEVPFEERRVLDEGLFATFPDRVREYTSQWPFHSWLDEVWAALRAHALETPLLGERIVRTRRQMERALGLEPFEVPLSAVCRTNAFAVFACALLADLPRLHSIYNGAVAAYRRRHGLRSENHPVPDLALHGDRWETPFWVWKSGGQRRDRLFAISDGAGLMLFAGQEPVAQLTGPTTAWPLQWSRLEARGYKVRTRALTTTLFTRLFLADLFMHGIGGGKYDEVTDAIVPALFDIEPPHYLVVTATLLLPLPRFDDADRRLRDLRHLARDRWYNPQRHLDGDTMASPLLAHKAAALVLPTQTHMQRAQRFHALQQATKALRTFVEPGLDELHARITDASNQERRHAVASARDYAFCLYPKEMLQDFFDAVLAQDSVRDARIV